MFALERTQGKRHAQIMRILGIDPGLATIGLGLIESKNRSDVVAIEWLTLTTPSKTPLSNRLSEIYKDLSEYLQEVQPEYAVIERNFFAANEQSALEVAHARGVILLALSEAKIPMSEVTPLQLKSAITGDGKADKRQVQEMIVRMLGLTEIPKPDDAADGLALAIYGALTAHLHEAFLTK